MRIAVLFVLALCAPACARAEEAMNVTNDTTLEKGVVLKHGLVIKANNVTIDGNGVTLQGPGKTGDLRSFTGAGIKADGFSNVTIRNLKVTGFESALVASNGQNWLIEKCDFSGNYHDPDCGWGDGGHNGGIILVRMFKCIIRECRANHNWNGLDLWECNDNQITKNDFSHCSNVCLKMWTACRNVVADNNLSYGLRMNPGETHARDSTSVLIESGSNDNRFDRNDITHGGDGVFIRVLNEWCSMGNMFVENDCSYANNNGFEAWSPGNTYIRNKAQHCSYGFWLGGSDHTVLVGNEAGFNGLASGKHNAPEADFQHGGIVIVGGTGSHTVIDGNYCHDNGGAGIVFRGDLGTKGEKWRMFHMIVQNNRLENNRWGLFMRFSDWVDLAGNTYKGNKEKDVVEEVTNLSTRAADPDNKPAPKARIEGPLRATVGEPVVFDASKSEDAAGRPLSYRWDIGDGKTGTEVKIEHVYQKPGFYRVGVTVNNSYLAGLAFRDFYVAKPVSEMATEGQAAQWSWTMADNAGKLKLTDDAAAIVGSKSLRMRADPYGGGDVSAVFPKSKDAGWNLSDKKTLSFWVKFENPNNGCFPGPNPIVRLHAGNATYSYTPAYGGVPRSLLNDLPYSEARHGWLYVELPLAGSDAWLRQELIDGAQPPHQDADIEFITINTPVEAQEASALVSTGKELYCATINGEMLYRSADGERWEGLRRITDDLGGWHGDWINGMLAYDAKVGSKGSLYLRHRDTRRNKFNRESDRLARHDIASNTWSWTPTVVAMGHGTTVVNHYLYGIAHALGGNFGGPICRVNLLHPGQLDERTVLGPMEGSTPEWFSRAAQFATIHGKIYGIKNDWTTPQPKAAAEIGDRLFVFDPKDFAASKFAGGDPWDSPKWASVKTPVQDLGPLPFEPGHGAALVALPPRWSKDVGRQGGLFIVAGCSPSNQEGFGPPSTLYAIYDIASGKFRVGTLPGNTGHGTSATFHKGKMYIKRGGMNYGPTNGEFWVATPGAAPLSAAAREAARKKRISLAKIDYLSLQFLSAGGEPFDLWIDGLSFE